MSFQLPMWEEYGNRKNYASKANDKIRNLKTKNTEI